MKKLQTRALTSVLLVSVLLLGGLMFSHLNIEETTAQQTGARTIPERWEYCAITEIRTVGGNFKATASANICYFQRSGCRTEIVEGTANVTSDSRDFAEAHVDAFSKAAAKLGAEGWEMVGDATQLQQSREVDRKFLYFRRRQR